MKKFKRANYNNALYSEIHGTKIAVISDRRSFIYFIMLLIVSILVSILVATSVVIY